MFVLMRHYNMQYQNSKLFSEHMVSSEKKCLVLILAWLGNLPVNWPKLLLLRPFQNGFANFY